MFEVQTQEFSGPLEKLLELIESKKMDITQISLAQVTADFLAYVENIKKEISETQTATIQPRLLADFLVVASQLLLIKSRSALPDLELTSEEEESIEDLERRLKLYQEIKPMVGMLRDTWSGAGQMFSRTSLYHFQPVFYPPSSYTTEQILSAMKRIIQVAGSLFLEEEKIERRLISLEAKIKDIAQKITNGVTKFSQVVERGSREEIVVLFLAVLHLLRDRILTVRQTKAFGDLEIERSSEEQITQPLS